MQFQIQQIWFRFDLTYVLSNVVYRINFSHVVFTRCSTKTSCRIVSLSPSLLKLQAGGHKTHSDTICVCLGQIQKLKLFLLFFRPEIPSAESARVLVLRYFSITSVSIKHSFLSEVYDSVGGKIAKPPNLHTRTCNKNSMFF